MQDSNSKTTTVSEPKVSPGSLWVSKDEEEVCLVTEIDQHGFAVSTYGWQAGIGEITTNFSDLTLFRAAFPRLLFQVKDYGCG